MKTLLRIFATLWLIATCGSAIELPEAGSALVEQHCFECHDSETRNGNLDLTALSFDEANYETWVKIHDRVLSGEMPPAKMPRPEAAELNAALASWSAQLTAMDSAKQQREGRSRLRRLNRAEFENSLRDLLAMPALKIKESLPEDGSPHGFDRLAGALDLSFVHMESYLAAVDKALDDALCPFPEQPPVFKYRFNGRKKAASPGRDSKRGRAEIPSRSPRTSTDTAARNGRSFMWNQRSLRCAASI